MKMLRRLSKDNSSCPPTIDELDEVTLRRPVPLTPTGTGPYFSRPMGPEFMRRSCTFVAEAGWRKSSGGGKDAKERQNLALKVRQKAAELGAGDEKPTGSSGRMQRLVGNMTGNLKSWSSSEDVRQSVMGALNRTVSVITQGRKSSKARNSIPELTSVTTSKTPAYVRAPASNKIQGTTRASGTRAGLGGGPKAINASPTSKYTHSVSSSAIPTTRTLHDNKLNNNSRSKPASSRQYNNNMVTKNSKTVTSRDEKDGDSLFKKPAAPVGYKHYRKNTSQQRQQHGMRGSVSASNMPQNNDR